MSFVQTERPAYPELLAFFRRRLPLDAREDAQDLCQETLMAALRSQRAALPTMRRPDQYVRGIAVHKLQDAMRRRYRRRTVPLELTDTATEIFHHTEANPEARIIESEARQELMRALEHLDGRERGLLELTYFSAVGHHQACERLGVSTAAGSRLKYRALQKLRRTLGPAGPAH